MVRYYAFLGMVRKVIVVKESEFWSNKAMQGKANHLNFNHL